MGDSSSPSGRGLEVLGIGLVVEEIGKGALSCLFRFLCSDPFARESIGKSGSLVETTEKLARLLLCSEAFLWFPPCIISLLREVIGDLSETPVSLFL